jgi:pimeloyl-ACP methyl ester carboxylesterase
VIRLKHFFALMLLIGLALLSPASLKRWLRTEAMAQSASVPSFLKPCHVPNLDGEVRCGKYEVYENRAAKTGRRINVNVVVVPALSATPAKDPVFWLHGGPGAAATQTASAAVKGGFLGKLREDRDLIFVDQRGTGDSNPLSCDLGDDPTKLQEFVGPLFPIEKVRQCRERLEKVADLALYTTPIAMDDLDEVRAALGYDQINLVAASYGTIAALVYMRQHSDHLRAVFLAGVANTNIRQPLHFAAGAQHAMDLLYEDCAADKECNAAFPNLRKESAAVLARFDRGPVTAKLFDLTTKQAQTVSIAGGNFVERIRLLLYTTTFARFVPFIIHKAFDGDYLPFETLSVRYNPGSILARGMYLTVTCSEGVPFITQEDIIRQTRGTFVGDSRVRSHIAACKEWPRGNVPRSYIDPVKSSVPVLMISGELDASTPPWLGKEALKTLPNGRQVSIRYYGHQVDSPCIWNVMSDFIAKGSVKEVDTACTQEIRRPPFAMEIPTQLALQ